MTAASSRDAHTHAPMNVAPPADSGAATAPAVPALFDAVPPTLFQPLTGRSAPLCWAVLGHLYVAQFEGPPGAMLRGIANEYAQEVLRTSPSWSDARDELSEGMDDSESSALDEDSRIAFYAKRLVDRLARHGWFHFEFDSRHGGEVVNFHPYASRLLRSMMGVARDDQPPLEGYAHRLRSVLAPASFSNHPGLALREAKDTMLEFVLELKTLNQNIGASTKQMVDRAVSARAVLEESFDRYQPRVMQNLHRLKTSENFFRIRPEIRRRFDEIEQDEFSLERAARWLVEQSGSPTRPAVDLPTAAATVRDDMRLVRMHVDALPAILDDIDRRNARFSGIARRKLRYRLQQHQYLESHLQALLADLAGGRLQDVPFELYRADLLHDDFLWTPPAKRVRAVAKPLTRGALPDAAAVMERVKADLIHRSSSRRMIDARVERLMAGTGVLSLAAVPVADDEGYVRAIHMVAYGTDGDSPYHFERQRCGRPDCLDPDCTVCRIHRGPYVLPNGVLHATTSRSRPRTPIGER